RAEIARSVPPVESRLRVIPIGVDTDRFRSDPAARSGRGALGVGVVAPLKRWELAAAAARDAGWSFRLVGPTPDARYLERVRAANPEVEVLGELTDDELRREYARADVLLHPSRVEVLAGAVLQGLSASLPVLGAEPIAGLVESGVTGWAAAGTADDEAIRRFLAARLRELSDPSVRQPMALAARASAEQRFGWPAVVESHLAMYRGAFPGAAER
ncbi:MAG: glycosyltransferase family 4 protein, partial [Thermoplasmata archaeon]|nr:glycosyltransferase family 4 protein [Thermoplasmata archaeon]